MMDQGTVFKSHLVQCVAGVQTCQIQHYASPQKSSYSATGAAATQNSTVKLGSVSTTFMFDNKCVVSNVEMT